MKILRQSSVPCPTAMVFLVNADQSCTCIDTKRPGYFVKYSCVTGDKQTRATGLASQMNVGNVKMLSGIWNQGLLQRLDAFPTNGIPDDEIDALADAFTEISPKKRVFVAVG